MSEVFIDPVRRPLIFGGRVEPVSRAFTFPKVARPISGEVCDGCESSGRCRRERLCWRAELDAIRAERAQP